MTLIAGVDLETTGLEQSEGHRIIEIAALLYDLDTQERKLTWVQRINPQRPIDPKTQAVHGISFEDVSKEPTFEAIAPKLVKILSILDFAVAHNGRRFDMPFINGELTRVGQSARQVPLVDTIDSRWATPFGKPPNLGELCFALDVPYDRSKAHGAEYDVDVMMQCFFKARKWGYYPTPLQVAA